MNKIVFCGFGKLGRNCLETLIDEGYRVDLILTHKELGVDSVDTFAIQKGLVYSYKDARKNLNYVKSKITEGNSAYLISVDYRYIIPKEVYKIPKYAMNIHGSLLPKYRGRTPHVWSIINGEDYAGVTSHIIEETVDSGDIIDQISVKITAEDTGSTLLEKFEKTYPKLLVNSLAKLKKKEPLTKQNEGHASFFGKRTPDMGYIDFYKDANQIVDFVRAQANPYPGAYYYLKNGRKIVINKVSIVRTMAHEMLIGVITFVNNDYYVRCKNQTLKIIDYKIIK